MRKTSQTNGAEDPPPLAIGHITKKMGHGVKDLLQRVNKRIGIGGLSAMIASTAGKCETIVLLGEESPGSRSLKALGRHEPYTRRLT